VVVNHGVLCWTSGCESWCVMLSQWLWIMVTRCVLLSAITQTQSAQYNTTWFTTARFNIAHMIHNHWLSIAHHDSQQLAQHYTPWFTITRISIAQHDSQPLAQHNTSWLTPLAQYNSPWFTSIAQHNSQTLAQHSTPLFTTTGTITLTMIHNHLLSNTNHD
jgi:hypothetical protein